MTNTYLLTDFESCVCVIICLEVFSVFLFEVFIDPFLKIAYYLIYMFVFFPFLFLTLISGFIFLWSEKILYIISIPLNLMKFVLWPGM